MLLPRLGPGQCGVYKLASSIFMGLVVFGGYVMAPGEVVAKDPCEVVAKHPCQSDVQENVD